MAIIRLTPTQIIQVPKVLAYALDGTVQAGFPSPAEDIAAKRIDVFERLVQHPEATYHRYRPNAPAAIANVAPYLVTPLTMCLFFRLIGAGVCQILECDDFG